jgi:hypothetical protein
MSGKMQCGQSLGGNLVFRKTLLRFVKTEPCTQLIFPWFSYRHQHRRSNWTLFTKLSILVLGKSTQYRIWLRDTDPSWGFLSPWEQSPGRYLNSVKTICYWLPSCHLTLQTTVWVPFRLLHQYSFFIIKQLCRALSMSFNYTTFREANPTFETSYI